MGTHKDHSVSCFVYNGSLFWGETKGLWVDVGFWVAPTFAK